LLDGYLLFFTIKYSQERTTDSCTEEIVEREVRVSVICESNLRRHVFIDIDSSNVVRKLAFMTLNIWIGLNGQGRDYFS